MLRLDDHNLPVAEPSNPLRLYFPRSRWIPSDYHPSILPFEILLLATTRVSNKLINKCRTKIVSNGYIGSNGSQISKRRENRYIYGRVNNTSRPICTLLAPRVDLSDRRGVILDRTTVTPWKSVVKACWRVEGDRAFLPARSPFIAPYLCGNLLTTTETYPYLPRVMYTRKSPYLFVDTTCLPPSSSSSMQFRVSSPRWNFHGYGSSIKRRFRSETGGGRKWAKE